MKSQILLVGAIVGLVAALPGAARAADEDETDAQAAQENRLRLEYHPVAPALAKGDLHFGSPLAMQPAGFRADKFTHYLSPTYGLGDGWEVGAALTGAQRIGAGGEAMFYGLGIQKQLMRERRGLPSLSIGGYGMMGPHSHDTGNLYLVATKKLWKSSSGPQSIFLTGGVKGEFFSSDDYKDDSGVRPFFGANFTVTTRFFVSGEVAAKQDWERDTMWALKGTYLVSIKKYKLGVSGGIRNNGYETQPFVGISL
jgi:hypothetical protein